MKTRCLNPNCHAYKDYGGRGITICDEWINSVENFNEWAISNGYNENLTLDRIDVNGNYEPSNCRWTSRKSQANNKRNNHLLTFNNETHTIAEWGAILNINPISINKRLLIGWPVSKALTSPIRNWNNREQLHTQ